jgi:hypothetical protein
VLGVGTGVTNALEDHDPSLEALPERSLSATSGALARRA